MLTINIDARSDSDPPVDPRGARFSAALTAVVLALVLVSTSSWLLAAQAAVFALGAFAGPRLSPYAVVFRVLIAPRIGPPAHGVSAAPVRFSQAIGLVLAVVGTVGYVTGLTTLGLAATAFALAAAFLSAAVGFCPGCELHALIARRNTHTTQDNNKQGVIV